MGNCVAIGPWRNLPRVCDDFRTDLAGFTGACLFYKNCRGELICIAMLNVYSTRLALFRRRCGDDLAR